MAAEKYGAEPEVRYFDTPFVVDNTADPAIANSRRADPAHTGPAVLVSAGAVATPPAQSLSGAPSGKSGR
jgi:hypothetical protein